MRNEIVLCTNARVLKTREISVLRDSEIDKYRFTPYRRTIVKSIINRALL